MKNGNINTVYGSADVLVACALASRCSINTIIITLTIAVLIFLSLFFFSIQEKKKFSANEQCGCIRCLFQYIFFFCLVEVLSDHSLFLYVHMIRMFNVMVYRSVHHTRHYTISLFHVLAMVHAMLFKLFNLLLKHFYIMIIGISIFRYIFVLALEL